MGAQSSIEWTDATWNPIVGCSIVSPGCINCYAMQMAARIEKMAEARRQGGMLGPMTHYAGTTKRVNGHAVWAGKVMRAPTPILMVPLEWKKARRIFVNSMGDLFHESIPDEWIDRVFAVMALCPQHTFQVLTKRADRMREYLTKPHHPGKFITIADDGTKADTPSAHIRAHSAMCELMRVAPAQALNAAAAWQDKHYPDGDGFMRKWPLPNVWLGISAERQQEWDERKEHLRATPAAIRFASFEPLLGQIVEQRPMSDYLQWAIVGGESGPHARPMHPDWARSLRDQCAAANVPYFFKQWGEWADTEDWSSEMQEHLELVGKADGNNVRVGKKAAGRLLDGIEHSAFPSVSSA